MEFVASQLASAASSAQDEDATPPAVGADAAQFASSQQAAGATRHVSGPRIEMVCRSNPQGVADSLQHFAMAARHRERVHIGRLGGAARVSTGQHFIQLTSVRASGISRNHAWLDYDSTKGVTLTATQGAEQPTFINGTPLGQEGAVRLLAEGDLVGFGGGSAVEEDDSTFVYRVRFVDVPDPAPMPPPPPRPAPSAATEGAADPAPAAAGGDGPSAADAPPPEARGRGERGGRGRKRKHGAEAADDAAAPAAAAAAPAAAVAGGLAAQAALAGEHSALVAPLNAAQRQWGRRALECAAGCYGFVQEAVRVAADGSDTAPLHQAIARMLHKVQALSGDSLREQKRAREAARTTAQQHAQHNHAAQRRNQQGGARGRGGGGGKGGGGKGRGSRGRGGKGGGGRGRGGRS